MHASHHTFAPTGGEGQESAVQACRGQVPFQAEGREVDRSVGSRPAVIEGEPVLIQDRDHAVLSLHCQMALARLDAEGGAGPEGPQDGSQPNAAHGDATASVEADIARMRVRLIALENLTIALLADAPSGQLDLVREMAAFITPRPGATRHPLTIQAANQMVSLVDRAGHFRKVGHDVG